ncbi:MAG: hypothetical protein KAX49_03015 [Halanaerobiales bacterium]|nr:hypothetical protein [Halanaerobiales bacterium]
MGYIENLDAKLDKLVEKNMVIPKPKTNEQFIKGWGMRRGEKAIIYYIPNHKNKNKPNQKGITLSEIRQSYKQLIETGELTRKWFGKNLSECAKEGGCNFTTIGGILTLLGVAAYEDKKYLNI